MKCEGQKGCEKKAEQRVCLEGIYRDVCSACYQLIMNLKKEGHIK